MADKVAEALMKGTRREGFGRNGGHVRAFGEFTEGVLTDKANLVAQALMAPGNALQGQYNEVEISPSGAVSPFDPALIGQATNMAGVVSLGSVAAPRPSGSLGMGLSANFDNWFSGSKVVGPDGSPMVVYHGSPDVRGIFAEGFQSSPTRGDVYFATDKPSVANTYADARRAMDYQNAEENVIPLYLGLKNPMVIDAGGQKWRNTEAVIKQAKDLGHDGVVIKNSRDEYNNTGNGGATSTVYAFFDPTQAKSALSGPLISRYDRKPIPGTGPNVGTYSPADPNIMRAAGVPIVAEDKRRQR